MKQLLPSDRQRTAAGRGCVLLQPEAALSRGQGGAGVWLRKPRTTFCAECADQIYVIMLNVDHLCD